MTEREACSRLIEQWEARARKAFPTDAMLINRHIRELHEALAQPVAAEPEMWRHKKSGGVYEFLMSVVNEADQDIHVVYRSVETCVRWSRRSIEFYDGRFERLPPTPA